MRRHEHAAVTSTRSPTAYAAGQANTPTGARTVQLTPDTVADLKLYLEMTTGRPAAGPLLPRSNGTRYEGSNASVSIIKPLVAQINAPPRWVADQGGHADTSPSGAPGLWDQSIPVDAVVAIPRCTGSLIDGGDLSRLSV